MDEGRVVTAAGLVQGIVLVTFPAASTILTSPTAFDLTSAQYGVLFLPQVILAVTTSLLGGTLMRRFTIRKVYLAGLTADLVAMTLLVLAAPLAGEGAAFALLLLATAFVGTGFGLTVPAINTLTAAFHPGGVDRAILVLNALLGLGTALAPVFVAVFVGLGFWWGLPVLAALAAAALLAVSAPLPLDLGSAAPSGRAGATGPVPARFWLFAAFTVFYGICETINGNWAQLEMTSRLGASSTAAALALTAFWGMVTVGRLLFAAIERVVPAARAYHVLPFVVAVALATVAALPAGAGGAGIAAFALAGLGCSALLPLTISFGEGQLVAISATVASLIIACYQVGYGVAAFGTGPLADAGVALPTMFAGAAVLAAAMGALSFLVTARPADGHGPV